MRHTLGDGAQTTQGRGRIATEGGPITRLSAAGPAAPDSTTVGSTRHGGARWRLDLTQGSEASIRSTVRRLQGHFPDLTPNEVDAWVREAFQRLSSARLPNYVPTLAEREVRARAKQTRLQRSVTSAVDGAGRPPAAPEDDRGMAVASTVADVRQARP
jgi:hypothetical protein